MKMEQKPKLTGDTVRAIYISCKRIKGDGIGDVSVHETVQGIERTEDFHAGRLDENRQAIIDLLNELPEQFHKRGGGGWTFLNACNDKNGRQWTGFHYEMEMLFMLGMAAGYVSELMPRDLWQILPGGMPYYMIDIK